jgi:hypothetical protein
MHGTVRLLLALLGLAAACVSAPFMSKALACADNDPYCVSNSGGTVTGCGQGGCWQGGSGPQGGNQQGGSQQTK